MEDLGRRGGGVVVAIMVMMMMMMVTCVSGREAHLHKVGDRGGWKPGVNYTEWASHEQFYVGDWLYFGFDKNRFNVLEVNKTSYESCIDQDFITNITRGAGRDVFNLTTARPYYFLSGGGYCWGGMKLAINAVDFLSATASAPAPSKNAASPDTSHSLMSFPIVLLVISLVSALLFTPQHTI